MMLRLQRYQLRVIYKPGKEAGHIEDFLSRAPLVYTEHTQMQTPTTVYAMGLSQPELEQVSHACDINFPTQTLETIKTHTAQDPVLQTLQASISRGWPENKQHIGQSLQPFWTYKEELTIDKGLIFKGNRVLIPAMLRATTDKDSHWSFRNRGQPPENSQDCFLARHDERHKELHQQLSTCNSVQRRQQKETLIPHQVPSHPMV